MLRTVYLCLLIWCPYAVVAQLHEPYGKSTRWATALELGGLSPLASINLEYSPIQTKKSFIIIRGGVGQLFTGYSWLTLPHAITWNRVLNGKRKGCPPKQPKNSLFAEFGLGGVYLAGATEETTYRWSPIIGVRHYFSYNPRAIGFWKAQLTPVVAGRLVPWGGISIGLLID